MCISIINFDYTAESKTRSHVHKLSPVVFSSAVYSSCFSCWDFQFNESQFHIFAKPVKNDYLLDWNESQILAPNKRHLSACQPSPLCSLLLLWFDLASVHIVVSAPASQPEVTETKRGADGQDTNEALSRWPESVQHKGPSVKTKPVTCDRFRQSWLTG